MRKHEFFIRSLCISLFALLSAGAATADATLEYPLVFEKKAANGDYSYVLLSTLNDQLRAKNMEIFPDRVLFSSWEDAGQKLDAVSAYVQEVAQELGMEELELTQYSLSAVTQTSLGKTLCYAGNPKEAVNLLNNLASIAISDQSGMIGWKYKQEKYLDENTSEDEISDSLPAIWKEWRGNGEAILYLWHETDGGEDVNSAIIPLCQP